MTQKRFLGLLMAGLLSVSTLAGCGNSDQPSDNADTNNAQNAADTGAAAPADGDLSYVTGNGKMKIGYTVYDPMNYTDESGEFTGFDTEFAKAVCEKLNVEPEFIEINWDTKVVELNSKNIDCIWNGMTISDDLRENMDISDPYVMNKQVVIINKANADKYIDTASLASANLSAEAGSAGEKAIAADENLSKASYVSVTKQTDALIEVKSGASDAAVLDWTLAKSMIGDGTDFSDLMMIDNLSLAEEEYGIGFRKDSDLCTKVNEIMKELASDGTLRALADKYELSLSPNLES